jgi:hypothetical protein
MSRADRITAAVSAAVLGLLVAALVALPSVATVIAGITVEGIE